MVLNIEYTQKIITPEIPYPYYSRDLLLEKILSYNSKRLILITAPAGYGKTSFSIEFFNKLKKELKLWISISSYDNSIENFFLLLSLAFENNLPDSNFGAKLKNVISKSQNVSLDEKINNVITSFSNDLFIYLKKRKKDLYIFLDDFHNIDESEEVCAALNYFLEYLPVNVKLVLISRRNPKRINYPRFAAKNWLGKITQSDLCFKDSEIKNFLKIFEKRIDHLDKDLLEEFLSSIEGWITAIQLLLMTNDFERLRNEDLRQSRKDIFDYFTNEIYKSCSDEEKNLLLILSFLETFDRDIIEKILEIENGYAILIKLYENNAFINKVDETYRFHELLKRFLNKVALEKFSEEEISGIYRKVGRRFIQNNDWRKTYIAINYFIMAKDYNSLTHWIKYNASDKLLLIHSSGLFNRIEEIEDKHFKNSLEYILLKVNTFIYKDKDIDKALDYLKNILRSKFSLGIDKDILIPVNEISSSNVNYYVEILMLICNCNFLKEGISFNNIGISEHILKFKLSMEQEIQFIVSLVKSYIATGENSKSRKYILRLKEIFNKILYENNKEKSSINENSFIEGIFSMLIFFDYGDYKTGNQVIKFILNNIDPKNFDLSNYSQACFAMFASYNNKDFEIFYNFLKLKNKERNRTIFSAYKNQFEFQTILRKFFSFEFKEMIKDLEIIKKNTYLKNYVYFIDSLILYCYNLINHPHMINRLTAQGYYFVSKTRLLILQLEASLLTKDYASYNQIISEIDKLKRENFTIFNQSVILFYESWFHALNKNVKDFKEKFKKFLNMSIEFDYENYIVFRATANKMNYVFKYAFDNNIESIYLKNIFNKKGLMAIISKPHSIKLDVKFLDNNKIYLNGKELTNDLWLRSKSKSIFLYFIYCTYYGKEITKESLIDDIFYNTKSLNYHALLDVEINKVRKTVQTFLSEVLSPRMEKGVIMFKDKKYFLFSNNFELEIQIDVEDFKKLCSSNDVNELVKAFEMYKTDFAKDFYQNWVEDIRENLKFMYSDIIHKLVENFEKSDDCATVVKLLEKLIEIDYNDEETIIKLLSIYHREKEYRKLKFLYKFYEKRLKKEFNTKPSKQIQKFYTDVNIKAVV